MSINPQNGVEPTIMVIFGATGDLAKRKLYPALFDLYVKGRLSKKFVVIAFARKEFSDESYRKFVSDSIVSKNPASKRDELDYFIRNIFYVRGNFDDSNSFKSLADRLQEADRKFNVCSNKLFYLAIPPSLYENILYKLSGSGLTIPCGGGEGWTRILIEKPFGNDIETAQRLDKLLGKLFNERQIFRIDHYLAKETIQNILVFRFSNALFEPIWNRKHVERIEIRMLEKSTLSDRGAFYDQIGALKDVGQNHLLAMLSLITMDYPKNFSAEFIQRERARVLRSISQISGSSIRKIIRGQYEGYLGENGVKDKSDTETFFSLTAFLNNKRWKGVPIELTAGKGLEESKTYINVHFKDINCGPGDVKCNRNTLTFRIQPNEGISVLFWVKKSGFGNNAHPETLSFNYSDSEETKSSPDAYERVLYDCIRGDQTLFASTKEMEHAWKFVTGILKGWSKNPIRKYSVGDSLEKILLNK